MIVNRLYIGGENSLLLRPRLPQRLPEMPGVRRAHNTLSTFNTSAVAWPHAHPDPRRYSLPLCRNCPAGRCRRARRDVPGPRYGGRSARRCHLAAGRPRAGEALQGAAESGGWDAVIDVSRDPEQARDALEVLAGSAPHWTVVSSCSVYADHSVPDAGEDAQVLPALAPGTALSMENYGEAKSAIEQHPRTGRGEGTPVPRRPDRRTRGRLGPLRVLAGPLCPGQCPVLVPDIPGDATQIIDVRDLAAWILTAAESGTTGALNAVGERSRLTPIWRNPVSSPTPTPRPLSVPEDWLASHGANYWAGPDSLPLWLPPGHDGFAARCNDAARAAGLSHAALEGDAAGHPRRRTPPRPGPGTQSRAEPGDGAPDRGRVRAEASAGPAERAG